MKDEDKRKKHAKRAIERIEVTVASFESFFSWPALFQSFRKDVEDLRKLE